MQKLKTEFLINLSVRQCLWAGFLKRILSLSFTKYFLLYCPLEVKKISPMVFSWNTVRGRKEKNQSNRKKQTTNKRKKKNKNHGVIPSVLLGCVFPIVFMNSPMDCCWYLTFFFFCLLWMLYFAHVHRIMDIRSASELSRSDLHSAAIGEPDPATLASLTCTP